MCCSIILNGIWMTIWIIQAADLINNWDNQVTESKETLNQWQQIIMLLLSLRGFNANIQLLMVSYLLYFLADVGSERTALQNIIGIRN